MRKHRRAIDIGRIFFGVKGMFDYRKSYYLDDLLRKSIANLYFEGKYDPEVDDILQSVKLSVRRKINEDISNYNRYKSYLRFYWSPEDEDMLIGVACPLPTDDEAELKNKEILGNAFLLESVLAELAPDVFEVLCKQTLRELGCQFTGKTRTTADGGVDFFGTMTLHQVEGNPFAKKIELIHNCKMHFIGQAKRYAVTNVIQPQHIREFLGSALLLEFTQGWNLQKELAIENLPPKYLMPKDPVIWLFFSTSFATINARNLANYLGIYFQDGEDISRWLARNPLSKCNQDKNELYFELTKWLSS
jgi:hypothetical protein